MIAIYAALATLILSPVARSAPTSSLDASIFLQNGQDAQALNAVFANLSSSDSCNDGEMACITNSIAHCVNTTWQLEVCSKSLSCFALPSVREQGIDISCTTNATALAIINASGATGGIAANSTDASVELPVDCDGDDESDPADNAAGSESSSLPISTSASASSASRTHKSSHSSSISAVASSATASASGVVTVTVTVASVSTGPTETFTLDPSQASSFLSSIATESGVSITTILPSVASSASAASVTGSAASSAEASSASVISSKQVGIASSPSGSIPAISAGPISTITLLGQAASASASTSAKASATGGAGSGNGYSY